ncbi:MAG: hypothetical protein IPL99_29670 [Candidatus Competibacteraceae bacterium]|nr:hypothetical protein [Candidatus Competibacteraceae bacterium]
MSASSPRTYEDIKALSSATGRKIPDLLAMSCQNDPFYIMPAQFKQAEWFAALWTQFDLPAGVHLRRIHYRLVSQSAPFLLVGGQSYTNTEKCWQELGAASKAARCLGLVAADAFEDKRNPNPVVTREYSPLGDPRVIFDWERYGGEGWAIPRIDADLAADLDWAIPDMDCFGYLQGDCGQPFHLELISEKSTMDDVIIPLCRELRINYAPATGFQSITGVVAMLQRLRQANKPGVVFYISDFDPAGSFMPPSVARQIEFWRTAYAPDLDVLLLPIALTPEQVKHYKLPPIPIKDTDKRQDNFLAKYGVAGATELDALEALHPGELAKIIRQETLPYRDTTYTYRAYEVRRQADSEIDVKWRAVTHPYRWRLARLKEQAADILDSYQDELESLRQGMNEELEPLERELESLRQAVKAEFAEFDPVLPDRYESPVALPEPFNGLFDSRRDYLVQLAYYKTT